MNFKLLKAGAVFILGALLFSLVAFQKPPSEINLAKQWFESNYPNAEYLKLPIEPDWNSGEVVARKDGSTHFDVPLKNSGKFEYSKENNDKSNKNGATHLVISKFSNGQYKAHMLRLFASAESVKKNGKSVVNKFKPHKIDDFSGYMVYTDLFGATVQGLYFEDGAPKSILTPAASDANSVVERWCVEECFEYWVTSGVAYYSGRECNWVCYYTPPTGSAPYDIWYYDPNYDPSSLGVSGGGGSGSYYPSDEGDMACRLDGKNHFASGPTVTVHFSGFDAFSATTDIRAKLTNCSTGSVSCAAYITGGDGGQINHTDTYMFVKNRSHLPGSKSWLIRTANYVSIHFEAYVAGTQNSQTGNGYNETDFYLTYR
jgi:hypothetical protein